MRFQMERYMDLADSPTQPRLEEGEDEIFAPESSEQEDLPSWASRSHEKHSSEMNISTSMAECQVSIFSE